MWPFKEKPTESKPKVTPMEDKCCFMEQITLDHNEGGSVTIAIQGKSAKHVQHVSKKIKEAFSMPKIKLDPSFNLPTPEQIKQELEQLNALKDVFDAFRKSKK